ncbi:hypothetical protein TD95_001161 [Thielaviopsis punctulata]|uniref:5'-Nucleotidase C-terminal domain-containing protein n=1 Tax=Thielaviopsis punctulata TaxID=72032 RepID=A0A0F4ZJZ6_9PEZI|nr:hypothetical protein TD95_001161 [Thielaviopsis punctulata]
MKTVALRALAMAGAVAAQDVLYSQRLSRRGIDANGNFNMTFFHVNDVHAHLDIFSSSGTDCTAPQKGCYGGYSRIKHVVDTMRPQYEDSLWLNAGDEFQGTMFYTYYKGEKIAETINQLGFDAMTLGNHEFDGGDDELGDFLLNLTFPVISANIQSTNAKLNATIKPYHIYDKQQIAVIGCTTETVPSISNPGKGTEFLDVVSTVQNTIDHIKATTNITRIVALTHIGYDADMELAQKTSGLSLIMGGHSHTLLGSMLGASGPYPTIETNLDGDEVFVVTAYRWGEYIGHIDVTFDDDGKVLAYTGGPIHIDNTTGYDAALQAEIDEWRKPFEAFANEVVGTASLTLDQTLCQTQECVLGDVITDAMKEYRLNLVGNVDADMYFALINAGGIRATIDAGDVTRGEVLTAFPFGNAIVELNYTGADVRKIFEGAVAKHNLFNDKAMSSFFQTSGIEVEYNPSLAVGSQVVSIKVNGKEIDDDAEYHMATLDFLATGGDNILVATSDYITLDTLDQVLIDYLADHSPVTTDISGRIVKTDATGSSSSSSSTAVSAGISSTVSSVASATGLYSNTSVAATTTSTASASSTGVSSAVLITGTGTGSGTSSSTLTAAVPGATDVEDGDDDEEDDDECEDLTSVGTVSSAASSTTSAASVTASITASAAVTTKVFTTIVTEECDESTTVTRVVVSTVTEECETSTFAEASTTATASAATTLSKTKTASLPYLTPSVRTSAQTFSVTWTSKSASTAAASTTLASLPVISGSVESVSSAPVIGLTFAASSSASSSASSFASSVVSSSVANSTVIVPTAPATTPATFSSVVTSSSGSSSGSASETAATPSNVPVTAGAKSLVASISAVVAAMAAVVLV